jgi:hypothetical protein
MSVIWSPPGAYGIDLWPRSETILSTEDGTGRGY